MLGAGHGPSCMSPTLSGMLVSLCAAVRARERCTIHDLATSGLQGHVLRCSSYNRFLSCHPLPFCAAPPREAPSYLARNMHRALLTKTSVSDTIQQNPASLLAVMQYLLQYAALGGTYGALIHQNPSVLHQV